MKKVAVVALMLLSAAGSSVAAGIFSTVSETGLALTTAAPTTATQGINLAGVTAYRWVVAAPSGQTITGGYMDCYYRPVATATWTPCLQEPVTLRTGNRFAPSFDYQVGAPGGRIRWVPRAITLSGAGTTVDVHYEVGS